MNPVPPAPKYAEFTGLTIHQRLKRVAYRWAESGFVIVSLRCPPSQFGDLEQVPHPFLTVGERGLEIVLLGKGVPFEPRFDGVSTMQMEFRQANGDDPVMVVEIELKPVD